ncbi:MAG: hypothetical protein ACREPQ_14745 [Rhodanobacter sp.]
MLEQKKVIHLIAGNAMAERPAPPGEQAIARWSACLRQLIDKRSADVRWLAAELLSAQADEGNKRRADGWLARQLQDFELQVIGSALDDGGEEGPDMEGAERAGGWVNRSVIGGDNLPLRMAAALRSNTGERSYTNEEREAIHRGIFNIRAAPPTPNQELVITDIP